MGRTYKELKKEIHNLKEELHVKSNRIALLLIAKSSLEDKVEELQEKLKSSSCSSHQFSDDTTMIIIDKATGVEYVLNKNIFNNLLIAGEEFLKKFKEPSSTPHQFSEWDASVFYKKGDKVMFNGKERTIFSDGVNVAPTRFMPNVKFKVPEQLMDEYRNIIIEMSVSYYGEKNIDKIKKDVEHINLFGFQCYYGNKQMFGNFPEYVGFKWNDIPEVSIYEAIPELVPEGMYYDKDADSLFPSSCIVANLTTCPYCKGTGEKEHQCREGLIVVNCSHCDGVGIVQKS